MLPTAAFSDAMGRNGTRTHVIKLQDSGFQTVGSAHTIRYYALDDLMLHYGLKTAKPGIIWPYTQATARKELYGESECPPWQGEKTGGDCLRYGRQE
jgi:hypothetical protein